MHLACSRPFKKSFSVRSSNCLVWFYTHTTTLLYVTRNNTLFFIQLLECYLPSPYPFSCTLHIFPFLYPPLSLSICLAGLVQRCVIIQKDENGFGLTVSGDNPVFVQLVKEGKKDTNPVVLCPCFALHNIHMQSSFTSDLNTQLSLLTTQAWIIIQLCNTTVRYNYDTDGAKYIVAFPSTYSEAVKMCIQATYYYTVLWRYHLMAQ